MCSKCTKIPGLNGKEGSGTSVYYMTGGGGGVFVQQTVRRCAVGCARGRISRWRAQGDKGLTVQVRGSFCVSGVELPGSATSELC